MVATFIMDETKSLRRTTSPKVYTNENNADQLLFLLPQYYGDMSIAESTVTLNIILPSDDTTQATSGNIKLLTFEDELYKDKFLQAYVPISLTETSKEGEVELYISITNSTDNSILKTSVATITVDSHKEITDYVNVDDIDLLSDYLIKLEQLQNTCNAILTQSQEEANKCKAYAELMYTLLSEWENKYGSN